MVTLKQDRKGFTIVELVIVIAVIGILATITVVAYRGVQEKARDAKRVDDLGLIVQAFQLWRGKTNNDFTTMSAGSGGGEIGWFDYPYAGYPSVAQELIDKGVLKNDVVDPRNSRAAPYYSYMITPCNTATTATQRVILAHLENPPSKTLAEQLGTTCTHGTFTSYTTTYQMNYGRLIELD